MSAPEVPGDAHGDADREDLSGDLRSVLVTSVLNLERLDEDLFRYSAAPRNQARTPVSVWRVAITATSLGALLLGLRVCAGCKLCCS